MKSTQIIVIFTISSNNQLLSKNLLRSAFFYFLPLSTTSNKFSPPPPQGKNFHRSFTPLEHLTVLIFNINQTFSFLFDSVFLLSYLVVRTPSVLVRRCFLDILIFTQFSSKWNVGISCSSISVYVYRPGSEIKPSSNRIDNI